MAVLYYKNSEGNFSPISFGGGEAYKLPVASAETLGGIKPDNVTVSVDDNGVLSADRSNGITLYTSGSIPRSNTDNPVEITIPNDNWYAIAINCNGIPPFALYIARNTDELALVRLAVHSAAESNLYAYASVSSVNGNRKLLIHSTDSGGVNYKIYKLPF